MIEFYPQIKHAHIGFALLSGGLFALRGLLLLLVALELLTGKTEEPTSAGGVNVAMGDGSVRFVKDAVEATAEKAADLIAGNTPLPAAEVPWYRHGQGLPLYPPGDPRNDAWDARTDPPSAAGAGSPSRTIVGAKRWRPWPRSTGSALAWSRRFSLRLGLVPYWPTLTAGPLIPSVLEKGLYADPGASLRSGSTAGPAGRRVRAVLRPAG